METLAINEYDYCKLPQDCLCALSMTQRASANSVTSCNGTVSSAN